jgi:hypothetical protein
LFFTQLPASFATVLFRCDTLKLNMITASPDDFTVRQLRARIAAGKKEHYDFIYKYVATRV